MKKSYFFPTLAIVLLSIAGYSQSNTNALKKSESVAPREKTLEEKMEGTYVIINKSSKFTQLLTTDILQEIEKKRDDIKEVYYDYSEYITIKILPRSVINAPGFDPSKY